MTGQPRILIVDDEEMNRELLTEIVNQQGYQPELAADGYEALAKAILDIDLVLLDVMMPGIDGFAVVRQLREDARTAALPVIMVTALNDKQQRLKAVEAGANDFVSKPVEMIELRARMQSLLRMKRAQDEVRIARDMLEVKVQERTAELRESLAEMAQARRSTYAAHLETIKRLATAAEYKDEDTAAHILRIATFARKIGSYLGYGAADAEGLYFGSLMHDVGKIGIPDSILLKPGPLTPEERATMQTHTLIGAKILAGSGSELLRAGEDIAMSHHERWDGRGYPRGLSGEQIPLSGRICAVVDVYDALTTRRPYKEAMSREAALRIMSAESAKHFDPKVFETFTSHLDEVIATSTGHKGDGSAGPAVVRN